MEKTWVPAWEQVISLYTAISLAVAIYMKDREVSKFVSLPPVILFSPFSHGFMNLLQAWQFAQQNSEELEIKESKQPKNTSSIDRAMNGG